MPAAELLRSANYFRAMAKGLEKTIQMAVQDLADARSAAREGDKSHPLTPDQALAIKCDLQREHRLWVQLAEEIDGHLGRGLPETDPEPETSFDPDTDDVADLFTPHDQEAQA